MKMLVLCVMLVVAAPALAQMERTVIVGDSLTADVAMPSARHLWVWRAAKKLDWMPLVIARGCQTAGPSTACCLGWCYGGAGTSYHDALHDLFYDRIVVLLGTNDFAGATPLQEFRTSYRALLNVWPDVAKVCIIPTPRPDQDEPNWLGLTLDAYRDAIRDV